MKLLLKKYIEGNCSASEKKQIEDALTNEKISAELQYALEKLWKETTIVQAENNSKESNLVLDRIHHSINIKENKNKTNSFITRYLKYAAAAIIFITISVGAWYSGSVGLFEKEHIYTVNAPVKQSSQISLPDGTMVWLNSGSSLTYSSKYGQNTRTVKLQGEGFFDVKKDKQHPFIVAANDVKVTALGTSFNVKSHDNNDKIIVTLEEGRIKTVRGSEEKILNPGMQTIVSKEKMEVLEVDTKLYTSWHLGKIRFKDESLLNIARQLEKVYDIKIKFASDSIKNYRYRGTFDTENSIFKTLEILQLSTNIEYTIDDKQIVLIQK
ncbi:FecR family protein [Plebeiibacterium marinum]|uniref:FecR family protein n=1 Tax=Plebeiibacterium marinum TaxID=2992111 RepID=A0AAE3SKV8_9BACT|nr:FecR family protein [Plebeiobacterium marinum]MCW3806933.1 FecR family protein [Plebeiobacterium marinum]